MKKLTCEMCGGTDLVKQDGVFVCQTCGTKYSVEEARKMMDETEDNINANVNVNDNEIKNENIVKGVNQNQSNELDTYIKYLKSQMKKESVGDNIEKYEKRVKKIFRINMQEIKNCNIAELIYDIKEIIDCLNLDLIDAPFDRTFALLLNIYKFLNEKLFVSDDLMDKNISNFKRVIRDETYKMGLKMQEEARKFIDNDESFGTLFYDFSLTNYSMSLNYCVDNDKEFLIKIYKSIIDTLKETPYTSQFYVEPNDLKNCSGDIVIFDYLNEGVNIPYYYNPQEFQRKENKLNEYYNKLKQISLDDYTEFIEKENKNIKQENKKSIFDKLFNK